MKKHIIIAGVPRSGKNTILQRTILILRHLRGNMTQEDLAEKMNVSRQTVSKWELDTAQPEMDKAIELCRLFNCSQSRCG